MSHNRNTNNNTGATLKNIVMIYSINLWYIQFEFKISVDAQLVPESRNSIDMPTVFGAEFKIIQTKIEAKLILCFYLN